MKYVFILNKFGQKDTSKIEHDIAYACIYNNYDFIIENNSNANTTHDILNKYKYGNHIIYAVGGDGMINRVLNEIVGTNNMLGYIPYGTGNDLDRSVKESLKAGIQNLDIVKINDKYYINVACFGIDAEIANDDSFIHNNLIPSSQRYNASVLYHFLKYNPKYFDVFVNDELIKGNFTTIAVCNGKYYGGGYKIAPSALLNDGLLDVYLVEEMKKLEMAKTILSMKDASHEKSKFVRKISTNKITINSNYYMECNIDGESYISNIFNIEVIPNAIKFDNNQELIKRVLKK
ncbi:MAG: hypothetical protein IJ572_01035 [Bacilli bacterium]|nr:hypothetical protein [Bacilli bacterium]